MKYIKIVKAPKSPPPPDEVILVIPKGEKTGALKAISDIRKLFGPKGENWIRGAEHRRVLRKVHSRTGQVIQKQFDTFCLIGGIKHVDGKYENAARTAIALAIHEFTKSLDLDEAADTGDKNRARSIIVNFNDSTGKNRGWPAVKKVLARAVVMVKEAAAK